MTNPIDPSLTPRFTPTLAGLDEEDKFFKQIQERKELEAILKDANRCAKLGIDREQEIVKYIRKYGSFMSGEEVW